ncbi:Outer membrane usher protein fimD precursor [Pseudomonas chlororaphis subsp. piscium]|uniref:fimbria/pilus outer membrane usher protein n=1 Tax=Pseudomonas chlororaphis TaxID=587753 RepID=UPI000F71B1B1|nr:fimbria/pilus outer membrane usher protein [Pseudomonas chlororaphis]AZC51711.1 Outer membrane usher protein fimD precursor [Pseudomonas chlororaphis subsp. piscium]
MNRLKVSDCYARSPSWGKDVRTRDQSSKKNFLLYKLITGLALTMPGLAFSSNEAQNAPDFDLSFLQGDGEYLDVAELLKYDSVAPGRYRVSIYVNRNLVGRKDIRFDKHSKSGRTEPCLNMEALKDIGVDLKRLSDAGTLDEHQPEACYDLGQLIEQATVEYDAQQLQLLISIPQAAMSRSLRGYVDPELWDYGVSAGFSNYQFNGRRSEYNKNSSNNYYLGLRNGLNIGPWRLRNESSLTYSKGQAQQFSSNRTYVQRDITALKSQLTVGESYTSSQVFDSARFLGVEMSSDDAMLPDSQRGYAPVIRGTAKSNATVEVSQNGYVLYSTNVSPGPFEINDIYPSGSNGDLQVTVIESDGSRQSFTQAYASLPQMVRQGMLRYNTAIGEYASNNDEDASPSLATMGLAYGLTNSTTLVGGLQWAEEYNAINFGVTQNTPWGAFAVDVTQSDSENQGQTNQGQSLRLNYAKTLTATDTTLTLATYRYSTEGYRTLSDHIADLRFSDGNYTGRARTRFDLTINQNLGSQLGSFYLNGTEQRYWNLPGSSRQFRAGYTNTWNSINYNVSVAHSRNDPSSTQRDMTQVALSISMPLGPLPRSPRATSTLNYDDTGQYTAQAGINGNVMERDDTYYNLQTGYDSTSGTSGSAGINAVTPFASLNAGYSHGRDYQSYNVGASGSVVAHAGGINLGQPVGETFTLAEVPSVSGVKLASHNNVTTGRNGYAVVPYAQPYRTNWVSLDTRDIGADVDIKSATQQLVPRRGSVTVARFAAENGRRVQFALSRPDGDRIPFGANVLDEQGNVLSITDPQGMAIALVTQEKGTLTVKWKGKQCQAEYALPENRDPNKLFDHIETQCTSII